MSVEVTRGIWRECRARGSALLLLVAIGDYANREGVAWPSVSTLAEKIKLSVRETQRLTAELKALGDLEVEYGAGKAGRNLYRVTCEGWLEAQAER